MAARTRVKHQHVPFAFSFQIQSRIENLELFFLTLPAEAECSAGAMDLVFVIDGSKSMGPANFELVKQFVVSIAESLNVSRTGSRVGLVQYSTKVRTEFALGQHTSARAIRQAVSRMQYMGRGSMTGAALRHMFQFSFSAKEGARPNVPRVSIVFTDGRSQDDVSEWANKAKNSGIPILFPYFGGIGGGVYVMFFSAVF